MAGLLKRNIAVECDFELQSGNFQRDLCGKGFRACDRAVGDGLRHCVLDLSLRTDADQFEKFAYAEVQGFFVHCGLPGSSLANSVAPTGATRWSETAAQVGRGLLRYAGG